MGQSGFVEEGEDAAGEQVVGSGVGRDFEGFDGCAELVGAEQEAIGMEVGVAKDEVGAVADGVERGSGGAMGAERGVVAVEDGEGAGEDERVHGLGVGVGGADGDESLPGAALAGASLLLVEEEAGGEVEEELGGGGPDMWFGHGDGVGDDGDAVGVVVEGCELDFGGGGEQVGGGQVKYGEDLVESLEGESALAVEEVGQM